MQNSGNNSLCGTIQSECMRKRKNQSREHNSDESVTGRRGDIDWNQIILKSQYMSSNNLQGKRHFEIVRHDRAIKITVVKWFKLLLRQDFKLKSHKSSGYMTARRIDAAPLTACAQSDRKRNLTKYNFIFLTGSTGWTGYNHT